MDSQNAAHEPIVELLQSLCDWCKSLADMTLFARILSLRIPVPGLSSMLSTGKWWQAALHFLVFQSEISPGSHPHTFSAVFKAISKSHHELSKVWLFR